MAEENFEFIGQDSGQNRASARTNERFQIEYQPLSEKEVQNLRDSFVQLRTAERQDGPVMSAEKGEHFLALGASKVQVLMYQQIMAEINRLSERVEELLISCAGVRRDESKFRKAMCTNLSGTGLRMVSGHFVPLESYVKVILTLPPLHPAVVAAIGKIVKSKEVQLSSGKKAFEAAMSFEYINEMDREEIVSYSFKRQREEAAKHTLNRDSY